MSLLIDIVDETGSVSEEMLKEVENLLQFAAEREGVQDQAEVSVTIVSNDDIHQINKEYRGKDAPTDVIKVRGAPAIGITAAFGLALAAKDIETDNVTEFRRRLEDIKQYLNSSRPTAINLSWALERLSHSVENAISVNEAKTNLVHEAIQIQVEDEETCRLIGQNALQLFKKATGS